jgi:hypothetical protein
MSDAAVTPLPPDVAQMTPNERMQAAAERAMPRVGPAAGEKLKGMLTKETFATVGAVAALGAVAQFSPVGWVADLAAIGVGAVVVVGAAALGVDVAGGLNDLKDYVQIARAAQTKEDLDKAAEHLARAVSTLGIDTIQAILLHKSVKEASPKAAVDKIAETKSALPAEEPSVCIPCQKAAAEKAAAEQAAAPAEPIVPPPKEIVPDPGTAYERNQLATKFYKESGKPGREIMSHRDGIDLQKPVVVKELQPGDTVVRWEFPGRGLKARAGDTYASYPGENPANMGIQVTMKDPQTGQTITRVPVTYKVTRPTQVLESTAKDLPTPLGAPTVGGQGGAAQIWIPDTAGLIRQ